MIKLNAIASLRADGSLQATGAMTPIAGVAFVTVQNRYTQTINVRQGLVALQTFIDVVNPLAKAIGVKQGMNATQGICTEGPLFQPAAPKT